MSQASVCTLCSVIALATAGGVVRGEEPKQEANRGSDSAEIDRLIRQLGSDKFTEREGAGRALQAIGLPALDALLNAAAKSDDAEIRRRASQLVEVLAPRYPELCCFQGHTNGINGVAFSPDGKQAMSAAHDHTIRVWDLKTGKESRCLKDKQDFIVSSVAFSPDGKRALSGGADQMVRLWDAETWKELACFKGHGHDVTRVAFSSDGRRAVSGDGDGLVLLWDVGKGEILHSLTGHSAVINCVAFTSDGKQALSGCWDGMRVWDVETGKEVRRFVEGKDGLFAVAFNPAGNRALSAQGRTLRLWDVQTGKVLRKMSVKTENEFDADRRFEIVSVAFSPDGRRALSGVGDNTIRMWDMETGEELARLEGHTSAAYNLAFGPDGTRGLSACHQDRTVRLWQLPPQGGKAEGKGKPGATTDRPRGAR
jgi:WD40 repeat protein